MKVDAMEQISLEQMTHRRRKISYPAHKRPSPDFISCQLKAIPAIIPYYPK
jgi:hypothetical protein